MNANLNNVLTDIENLTGFHLCLKVFPRGRASGFPSLRPGRALHLSQFCRRIKQTQNRCCVRCDTHVVPALACSHPEPFTHRCHAGATEIIIPVFRDRNLVAIGYLGQFRESDDQPLELPLLESKRVRQLLTLCQLLQQHLNHLASKAPTSRHTNHPDRRSHIITFLQGRLRNEPSLAELAQELKLSPSRTGHLVKELTGETFVALKLRLKVEAVKVFLMGTMLPVETIAAQVGFQDVRYFHRVFRRVTGSSPSAWRKQHVDQAVTHA